MPALNSVWLPDVMRLNDNVTPAGQTAGFLGEQWDPERMIGDPSAPDYQIEGLMLPEDVPPLACGPAGRSWRRSRSTWRASSRAPGLDLYSRQAQDAFGLLSSGAARAAFDLGKEPPALHAHYGPGRWGPCLLLARRLVEAGVRLVHVNWPRRRATPPSTTRCDTPTAEAQLSAANSALAAANQQVDVQPVFHRESADHDRLRTRHRSLHRRSHQTLCRQGLHDPGRHRLADPGHARRAALRERAAPPDSPRSRIRSPRRPHRTRWRFASRL